MRRADEACGQEQRPAAPPVEMQIRWMNRGDFTDVLPIERDCFEFPWLEEDFVQCLRARNCIAMVCERSDDSRIAGYMSYELKKHRIEILNFAVDHRFRRDGVGTAMIEKLKSKLTCERRSRITLHVRETNVRAQLFFRAMGFRAVNVVRGFYDDTHEDAYLFNFSFR